MPSTTSTATSNKLEPQPPRAPIQAPQLDALTLNDRTTLGTRVRALRIDAGLSLRSLGEMAQLSASFLSLVERGQASMALTSLLRVATALAVSPTAFFAADATLPAPARGPHLARGSRRHFGTILSPGRTYRLLSPGGPGLKLEPMLLTLDPQSAPTAPAAHHGEEFLFVVSGSVTCVVEGSIHLLHQGDSLHLASEVPHAVYNEAVAPAELLWLQTPPLARPLLGVPTEPANHLDETMRSVPHN